MRKKIYFLTIFSMAMGFLESVVVIYLRQLYYPEGFGFPLREAVWEGLSLEYFRELATIVMLLSVSALAGRTTYERFSYFLYCFGVWDIFYYAGLKVLLNWPPSLCTWDVLFLIPVLWLAPVLAPMVCATTIIIYSGFMLYYQSKGYPVRISFLEWSSMSLGALVIFITFVWDYSKIIIQGEFLRRVFSLATDMHFKSIVTSYIPGTYNWHFFILGEFFIFCSLLLFVKRMTSIR
jgi:hypothetical protein